MMNLSFENFILSLLMDFINSIKIVLSYFIQVFKQKIKKLIIIFIYFHSNELIVDLELSSIDLNPLLSFLNLHQNKKL